MNTFAQAVNSNMDELPASHFMDAVYRQHNSPGCFIEYFSDTIKKLASTGKTIYLLGDFNLCLLKTEKSQYSQDFLLALQGSY